MSEDVAQRRLRSLPQAACRSGGEGRTRGGSIINPLNVNSPSSPPPHLTPYPLPALRRHKPPRQSKSWMGRPYSRGQCYPMLVDSCNNNTPGSEEESVSLLLEDQGDEGSTQRHTARFFAVCFILLFLLLLLYLPVYHQVQVREGGLWALQFGGMWRSANKASKAAARQAPIAGWAKNSTRDLRIYVQPDNLTALIEQPSICGPPSPILLLVVVCSAVTNFEARQAVRDTWGSPSNGSDTTIRLAFLLGATESEELQSRVETESASYGDVIQEGFLDTYNNLTLKSVMLLKWVRSHCRHARYVMKTDDDMFVNLGRLVTQLRADVARFRPPSPSPVPVDLSSEPRGLLLGALICGARPIANTRSKWYAPRYMYAERTYPNYLSGTGYVMSADVVLRLFNAALRTPLFHLEDVYLTGMCARSAGLRPRDHPGFSYQRRKLEPCAYRNSLITSHRLNSTDLRQVWQRIQSPDLQCPLTTVASKVRKGGRASKACV